MILLTGGKLLNIHLNRAFARNNSNIAARVSHLYPHGVGQTYAHGAKAAGVDPATGLVETIVLSGPHLVLANVGGNKGIALSYPPKRFDNRLRLNDRIGWAVIETLTRTPIVDLLPPAIERCRIGRAFDTGLAI